MTSLLRDEEAGRVLPPLPVVMTEIALALACIAPIAVILQFTPAIRFVAVFAFVLTVPGVAVMNYFPTGDLAVWMALVAVISLAAFAAESALMVWLHLWSPTSGLILLAAACAIALSTSLWMRRASMGWSQ